MQRPLSKHPLFFPILITAIYFITNLILVLCHEPYSDEVNPWLVAKEFTFSNFFEVLRGEPHPLLWTLILAPFAKLGFPFITANIISLLIMTTSVYLLARYAPWGKITKTIIIVSAAFFYYLPVISRDYCIVALAITLICVAYKTRLTHPTRYTLTIALLLQSHFIAAGLAAALYITFLIDYFRHYHKPQKPHIITSLIIISFTIFISLLTAIPSLNSQTIIQDSLSSETQPSSALQYLASIDKSLYSVPIPIIELTLIAALIYLALKYTRQFIFLFTAIAIQICIIIFIYKVSSHTQRNLLPLLYILLAFWTIYYDKPSHHFKRFYKKIITTSLLYKLIVAKIPISTLIVVTPCVLSIPHTLAASIHDLTNPFNLSTSLADFINHNLPEDSIIIIPTYGKSAEYIAAAPYLQGNRHFWDADTRSSLKYIDYTIPEAEHFDLTTITSLFPPSAHLYYLGPIRNNSTCTKCAYTIPPDDWPTLNTFSAISNPYFSSTSTAATLYEIP
jgi:hypothetical protein